MAIINDTARETSVQSACTNLNDVSAIVKKNLMFDRESIDLNDQLNVSSMYSGVCSGLKEDDYPLIEGANIPFLTDIRRVPLPPELVEQFGHMQCNCIMGIFPEIGRAWLTVDSDIFVWRYADGDDLAYFDGLAETILSVSLVQPKPGIFREHIRYLLILTTPLDVVILGVSFAENDVNNEMHLLPDPLFTISSDSTYLLHTVGTIHGRIFTGGKDGCLYEIIYQAKRGWFSRSCTKVNHSRSRLSFLLPSLVNMWFNEEDSISQLCVDDTRNILYTRSEKGTISVYDLGDDGFSTSCVAQLRLDSIQRRARDIASGIEPSNLNQIIHIAPITRHESRHMHLLAVTQAGVRLYFITYQSHFPSANVGQSPNQISQLRPTGIHLVHVRLPPGFTGTSLQRPSAVHAAHYNAGTLLLSASNGDDGVFWCVNRDMFAFSKILKETHSNFPLDGRAWAISEVASPLTEEVAAVLPFGSTSPIPPDPAIQVIQHIQKPPEYVVITSQGCHLFSKMRPVDQLRYLLDTVPDAECHAVESFFRLYDNGEAACCCIILAMSSVPSDQHISEKAVMALVHYGGVLSRTFLGPSSVDGVQAPNRGPHAGLMSPIPLGHQQQIGQSTMMTSSGGMPIISTPMPGYQAPPPVTPVQYQASPSMMNSTVSPNTAMSDPACIPVVYYSERQHGCFKMFSRIVRPLWEGRLVQDHVVEESGKRRTFVVSRLDVEVVSSVLDHMNSLRTFVGKYCLTPVQMRDLIYQTRDFDVTGRSFLAPNQGTPFHREQYRAQIAEMANAELTSLKLMYDLLVRSCEVLGLWRILLHHQIHVLFDSLDKQCQASLKTITFQDLVLSGEATCAGLISTLVNQFMDDHVTVDALNSQLRDVCPSLYSADDAICSKATELLHTARSSSSLVRKENLQRASQLFQQVAATVQIGSAIQQFQSVHSYPEAVELCIKSASARDPNGMALKLYQSGLSVNDPQVDSVVRKAYMDRMECYKYVTDILDDLTDIAACPPQAPSVPLMPGPPKPPQESGSDPKLVTPEQAQLHADNCLRLAIQSDDELLHVTVYEWLLRKNLSSQLLQINSPYIEPFLRRVSEEREEVSSSLQLGVDLLWKHHERNGQHFLAAEVLLGLAEKPGSDRDLEKRIEYLSRAKVNAKSVTSVVADSTAGGALLHDIEEKMEVAQIQVETLERMREQAEPEAISRLNSALYDVTTLYSEFAEPYQLAECKLSIAHCSGLHDVALIKGLWKNIIEDELQNVTYRSNTSLTSSLKSKIVQLSRKYNSSHRYFPVEYLTIFLEKLACTHGWEVDWVFTCMFEAGVPIHDLLDVYIKTNSHKLPCWASYSKPHHLLEVENEIIRVFLEAPSKFVPSVPTRRRFVDHLLDVLAAHLVELRSITSPSQSVQSLIGKLRRNQAELSAMQAPRS